MSCEVNTLYMRRYGERCYHRAIHSTLLYRRLSILIYRGHRKEANLLARDYLDLLFGVR